MKTLSQRDLRNNSADVMRQLAAGESFLITNDGVPVGKLVPTNSDEPELRVSRPATRKGGWGDLPVYQGSQPVRQHLDYLREDRA